MESKLNIPFEIRVEFSLYYHALDCFSQALDQCKFIIKREYAHHLHLNMLTAFYVVYGKPFKANRGIGKLPESFVPEKFKNVHNQIMYERDKLFAHLDVDGKNRQVDEFLCYAELHVSGNIVRWKTATLISKDSNFNDYAEACETLMLNCKEKAEALTNNYINQFSLPPGIYRLNIRDKNGPGLILAEDKGIGRSWAEATSVKGRGKNI